MVAKKITDLTAASSLGLADLFEVTHDPVGSPASVKASFLQVANVIGPPSPENWYDTIKASYALGGSLPGTFGGDFTAGIKFRVMTDRTLLGAKFYWAGGVTTVAVKVWQAGSALGTKTMATSGAGDHTATFGGGGISLSAGVTYSLSVYDMSATEYTANSSSARHSPEFFQGWARLVGYCYAAGDAEPGTSPTISSTMLLVPTF